MLYRKKTINNVATLENLSRAPKVQGVPLGTWASFENGVAPGNCWLEAGTTFDPEEYPAAYMYLNDTTVPERFDHSKLSEWESITISTNSESPTVMQYDGFLYVFTNPDPTLTIYVNETALNVNMRSTYTNGNATIPVKKGDNVYYNFNNSSINNTKVAYYKQHLFFKATSELDSEQATSVFNSMKHLNDYSTEETLTGGTWIDGKPIYRIVVEDTSGTSGSQSAISSSAYDILSTKNIEKVISACWSRPASNDYNSLYVPVEIEIASSSIRKRGMSSARGYEGSYLILEYTKTTDTAPSA